MLLLLSTFFFFLFLLLVMSYGLCQSVSSSVIPPRFIFDCHHEFFWRRLGDDLKIKRNSKSKMESSRKVNERFRWFGRKSGRVEK